MYKIFVLKQDIVSYIYFVKKKFEEKSDQINEGGHNI